MAKWPSPQDYFEAIQDPNCINDPELRAGELQLTESHQLPLVFSGQFAIVFKIKSADKTWAVRCFLQNFQDRTERYKRISEFILKDDLEYTVNFELIENGIKIRDTFYPILKMEFVSGSSLGEYLRAYSKDTDKLKNFQERFSEMMLQLRANGIAHGDLQHDNIVITQEGRIRLIDYDGMFVPSLSGHNANELGHANYQHPKRAVKHFDHQLDNFSAWLIKESIDLLIEENGTVSLAPHGDYLFLNRKDFENPHRSRALFELERLSKKGRAFSQRIRYLLSIPPLEIPSIDEDLVLPKLFDEDFSFSGLQLPEWLDGFDPTTTEKEFELEPVPHPKDSSDQAWLPNLASTLEGSFEQSFVMERYNYQKLVSLISGTGEHPNKDAIKQLIVDRLEPGEYLTWTGGLAPWLLSTRYQSLKMNNRSITTGQISGVAFACAAIIFLFFQTFTVSFLFLLVSLFFLIFVALHKHSADKSIRHAQYALTNKKLYVCFDGPRELRGPEDYYHWDSHLFSIPLDQIESTTFPIGIGMNERIRINLASGQTAQQGRMLWLHGLTEIDRKKLFSALRKSGLRCEVKEQK